MYCVSESNCFLLQVKPEILKKLTKNITPSTHSSTIYTHLNYDDVCVTLLVLAMFQSDTSLHPDVDTQTYVRYSFECLLVQS
jgi:hypothetical protein